MKQTASPVAVETRGPAAPLGLYRFALATAAATFVLIFVGGLVTSTGSALAVPDWPLSFGTLFPRMQGGVLYEHGHRMAAGTVAILTLVLAIWAWRSERRVWVKYLAAAAFGLIIVQAVLGGLTVLLLLPLPIAVAHAATAQAFLCMMVALAAFTNPRWFAARDDSDAEPPRADSGTPSLPALATVTTGVIYLQILIGALMRHMGAGLAIPDFPLSFGRFVPPIDSPWVAVNFAHRCGALVVLGLVIWTFVRVVRAHREERWLTRPATGLLALLVLQISLGAITIWGARAVIPTTTHVAVGAAVLATSLVLTLRAFRLLAALPAGTLGNESITGGPRILENHVAA